MKQSFAILALCSVSVAGQANPSDWSASGGGNWFAGDNWSAGVPDSKTATAVFGPTQPSSFAFINLTGSHAELQGLVFDSLSPVFINNGTLAFDATGVDTPEIIASRGSHSVLTDIVLNRSMQADVGQSVLTLGGDIQGTGDLFKTGNGELRINGSTAQWEGLLSVRDGLVTASSSDALPAGLDVQIAGGTLDVGNNASANIFVDRGRLQLSTGPNATLDGDVTLLGGVFTSSNESNFNGTLQLPQDSTGQVRPAAPLTLAGGTTGQGAFMLTEGTARFTGDGAHLGGTLVDSATLILNGGSLVNTNAPIQVINSGTLILDRPIGTDANLHSVRPNSVRLDNASLRISADINPLAAIDTVLTASQIVIATPTLTNTGTPVLDFDTVTDGEHLRLTSAGNVTIDNSLALLPHTADNTLKLGGTGGTLTINSTIADRNGAPTHLDINGPQTTRLSTTNTFTGQTTLNGGSLLVTHPQGLGPGSSTVVNAGTLRLGVSVVETIRLDGGVVEIQNTPSQAARLELKSGQLRFTGDPALDGPLVALEDNTVFLSGAVEINGGSSGPGGLNFRTTSTALDDIEVRSALNHAGGLVVTETGASPNRLRLYEDSTYAGPTTIRFADVWTHAPLALGDTSQGTTLTNNARLFLDPRSPEHVTVLNSVLFLGTPNSNVTDAIVPAHITLGNRSELTAVSFGSGEFHVANPIQVSGNVEINSGRTNRIFVDGGIVGGGVVNFDNVEINSRIDLSDDSMISGGVTLNTPNAYSGHVRVDSNLSPSNFLIANADQHFARLEVGRGWLISPPGVTIRADIFRMANGVIDADLGGTAPLQLFPDAGGVLIQRLGGDIPAVELYRGSLHFGEGAVGADVPVKLAGPGDLTLVLDSQRLDRIAVANELFLNNKTGVNGKGAIYIPEWEGGGMRVSLSGPIHLGDIGSVIGGGGPTLISGPIDGGRLKFVRATTSGSRLGLSSAALTYTGPTVIESVPVSLLGDAVLTHTSAIEVMDGGALRIETDQPNIGITDRVDDTLTVRMSSGRLALSAVNLEPGSATEETIGTVVLAGGLNEVGSTIYSVDGFQPPEVSVLTLGEAIRSRGAVLNVQANETPTFLDRLSRTSQYEGAVVLDQPPAMINGVLPAWIQVGGQYATLGPNNQIERAQLTDGQINDATATDNLRIRADQAMTANRRVNALRIFERNTLDLGGHQLTLESGGIELSFGHTPAILANGTLTAGQDAGNELTVMLLSSRVSLDASIVDNGQPLDVIYTTSRNGGIEILTRQGYTGTTYLTGADLSILSPGAIPAGGDVVISHRASLSNALSGDEGLVVLGDVLLTGGGSISANNPDAKYQIDKLTVESGNLNAPLIGNGLFKKTGTGTARLLDSSPTFTGEVRIEAGTLLIEDPNPFPMVPIKVFAGGAIRGTPDTGGSPDPINVDFEMHGGALLAGNYTGNVTVFADSSFVFDRGHLGVRVAQEIDLGGDLTVTAGQTLHLDGEPGSSELTIAGEFVMQSGSTLAGSGRIRKPLSLFGVTLDPGPGVGVIHVESVVLGINGAFHLSINDPDGDAGGTFGRGWDLLKADGNLLIGAPDSVPFVVHLHTEDLLGQPRALETLDLGQAYAWPIAEAGSITGFPEGKVLVDVSAIEPFYDLSQSEFSITREGSTLVLIHTPIPEPTSLVLLAIGAGLATLRRQR